MRVRINLIDETIEENAVINCNKVTNEIREAKSLLENTTFTISCVKDGESYSLEASKIYYIESIDNRTIISTKTDSYESKLKLYELEELLDSKTFLRCSKSMICNIRKINSVKADMNARFIATLLNNESIVISRSYAKELKKMLGI